MATNTAFQIPSNPMPSSQGTDTYPVQRGEMRSVPLTPEEQARAQIERAYGAGSPEIPSDISRDEVPETTELATGSINAMVTDAATLATSSPDMRGNKIPEPEILLYVADAGRRIAHERALTQASGTTFLGVPDEWELAA